MKYYALVLLNLHYEDDRPRVILVEVESYTIQDIVKKVVECGYYLNCVEDYVEVPTTMAKFLNDMLEESYKLKAIESSLESMYFHIDNIKRVVE